MALDAVIPRAVYAGTGAVSVFPVEDSFGTAIYFESNSHIFASTYDTTTYVWTSLEEGTDYTLTGSPTSGSLTLTAGALAVGQKLVIWREQPIDQSATFGTAANFSSSTHNALADRHRRIDQDLTDKTHLDATRRHDAQFIDVVDEAAPGAAHRIGGPNHHGVAQARRHLLGFLDAVNGFASRHFDAERVHGVLEGRSILAALNGVDLHADDLDTEPIQGAFLVQFARQVEARLAAEVR